MHAVAPPPPKKAWNRKVERTGYFVGAVLLHLLLFILLATLVIWKAPDPPQVAFQAVSTKTVSPPPPAPPPASGAAASNPQMEPQQVTVPVVSPPSLIMANNSAFKVDIPKADQAMAHFEVAQAQGSGMAAGAGLTGTGTGTGFGSSDGSGKLFSGYFYDFKQTPDHVSTRMTPAKWRWLMSQYIAQNWDEAILRTYFRSKSPLYTGMFAVSTRLSEEAPKAFQLEKDVQPAMWAVHYHAKVTGPDGDYRFVGFGDDALEVRIDHAMVLDAGWISLSSNPDLHQSLPTAWSKKYTKLENDKDRVPGMGPTNGLLKMGSTFHLDSTQPVEIDVLIGDQGGYCAFYLLIEKVGGGYEKQPDGTSIIPFFQIGGAQAPAFSGSEEHPRFSLTPEPWQGVED